MNAKDIAADEDVGNIVSFEHVNVTIPDQQAATAFYIMGMGFTRDPYMNVGLDNMWINIGEQQFHLPSRPTAQVIPGHVGLAVSSLDELAERLEMVAPRLTGTQFAWSRQAHQLDVTCPWGNHFRVYEAGAEPASGMHLGVPYVEFETPPGSAAGIARFYSQALGAKSRIEDVEGQATAIVSIGKGQRLVFTEGSSALPAYDGHHIAIYISDFSGPCTFLAEHELITEDLAGHQLRFQNLIDPETGQVVFTLEHEVRSLKHPMFRRPLVNRDPAQTQVGYMAGRDAFVPAR